MNTKDFLENIHQHNNLKLRFTKIIKETKKSIVVELSGRCLNGSYVYEDTQVESYLTDLRIAFNGAIKYVGGGNVYSFGEYIFEFENKSWIQDGKNYSASGYEAFAIGYGETWALMYRMYRGLKKYDTVYDFVGLKLSGEKVMFDNKHIFTCNDYKDETHHHFSGGNTDCSRTYFHASFNCFINEKEMMEIYIEINKRVLEHNIKIQGDNHTLIDIYYKDCRDTSPYIVYEMSDETFSDNFRVGDTLLVPLKEKTTRNRDLTVQLFKVGDTYVSEDEYIFTITNVSYSVEGGFSYKSFARKGESNVYSGIDQLNLLKIKEPTTNIEYPELMSIMGSLYFNVGHGAYDDEYSSPYDRREKLICVPRRLNSFSFKDDKILVEGCEIHQFIKKFIPDSLKEIEDRYTLILRDIKNHKITNKETLKKLEAYNGMFKGKNYGVLNREIKQIGDDLSVRQRKNERLLEEGLLLAKMFGGAKRKNIKLKSKLELLGVTE